MAPEESSQKGSNDHLSKPKPKKTPRKIEVRNPPMDKAASQTPEPEETPRKKAPKLEKRT
jgi:hypothetical protein